MLPCPHSTPRTRQAPPPASTSTGKRQDPSKDDALQRRKSIRDTSCFPAQACPQDDVKSSTGICHAGKSTASSERVPYTRQIAKEMVVPAGLGHNPPPEISGRIDEAKLGLVYRFGDAVRAVADRSRAAVLSQPLTQPMELAFELGAGRAIFTQSSSPSHRKSGAGRDEASGSPHQPCPQ